MRNNYYMYLKSYKWNAFRKKAILFAGRKCQSCGANNKLLQVHHLHYRTLGNESFSDVAVLCETCHRNADKIREFNSGLDTYATKKYGDSWYRNSEDRIEQEFEDWIEKKDRDFYENL